MNIFFTSAGFPNGNAASVYCNNFLKGIIANNEPVEVYLFNSGKNKNNYTDYGVKYTFLSSFKSDSPIINKIATILISSLRTIYILILAKVKCRQTRVFVYNNTMLFNIPLYFTALILRLKIISFVPEYYTKPTLPDGLLKIFKWYGFFINLHIINLLSSHLIVFSQYLEHLYLRKKFPAERIIIQPNLTDFEYWKAIDPKIEFQIGYAGSASENDGLRYLIEAVSILKDKGEIIKVLIVGDSLYGKSVLPALKKIATELDVHNQITFAGIVPHDTVKFFLHKCQILLISRIDNRKTKAGFPTKVGEYFACEKVLISSNFGDIDKYFSHEKEIIYFHQLDSKSLADRIDWIIHNPEEVELIRINGYEKAFRIFDYKTNVRKILNSIVKNA